MVTAGLLASLALAVAFRGPITEAIGTDENTVPASPEHSLSLPALESSTYFGLPRRIPREPTEALHEARDPFTPVGTATASTPTPVSVPTATHEPAGGSTTYRVRAGDSLWTISRSTLSASASDARIAATSRRIYDVNRAVIGPDPSTLHVGATLQLP
jgi:nucleoid-associated protein YgaU